MPNPIMRSFAKKADTTVKKVERLWNKSEKLVKKKYELTPEEDSDRFYALVVSVLKKILGLDKKVDEDAMTTGNIGAYQFYDKVGTTAIQRGLPVTDSEKEKIEKESKEKVSEKELAKRIKKIVNIVNEDVAIFDEFLDYFRTKYNNPDDIIEKTIEYTEKKLGIIKSGLNK